VSFTTYFHPRKKKIKVAKKEMVKSTKDRARDEVISIKAKPLLGWVQYDKIWLGKPIKTMVWTVNSGSGELCQIPLYKIYPGILSYFWLVLQLSWKLLLYRVICHCIFHRRRLWQLTNIMFWFPFEKQTFGFSLLSWTCVKLCLRLFVWSDSL
jgi:hypothetical protein